MTRASEQISVLMVDDDPAIRELLAWLLEEEGCVVHLAEDGADALRKLDEIEHVDLVLSDVNMPVMDGIELSRRLYAMLPGLPMLLMSGRQHADLNRTFIPKPFRWDALRETMYRVIGHGPSCASGAA